jgi:hypothetical protein
MDECVAGCVGVLMERKEEKELESEEGGRQRSPRFRQRDWGLLVAGESVATSGCLWKGREGELESEEGGRQRSLQTKKAGLAWRG